jgi:hypothetical protein
MGIGGWQQGTFIAGDLPEGLGAVHCGKHEEVAQGIETRRALSFEGMWLAALFRASGQLPQIFGLRGLHGLKAGIWVGIYHGAFLDS